MSIGDYLEPRILNAVFNNTSLAIAATYVAIHIGEPGEAGTANAAVETTRKAASWAAAVGGTITTDAALQWLAVAGTEDVTHISVWDNLTAGNHLWNGALTAAFHLNVGDEFLLPAGSVTCNID